MYTQRKPNYRALGTVVLLAAIYGGMMRFRPALVGSPRLAGSIGVILGLYICSRPAANMIDMLFYGRSGHARFPSQRAELVWLALNLLVLVVGYAVLVTGTTRFAIR